MVAYYFLEPHILRTPYHFLCLGTKLPSVIVVCMADSCGAAITGKGVCIDT